METHPVPSSAEALRRRLDLLFAEHDRDGAVDAALDAVTSGALDVATLYHDVLVPAIKHVGGEWQSGRIRVWEEHFASAVVRTIVEALYPRVKELKAAAAPTGRRVVLACIVDERHDLGLRMLADVFEIAGWSTYYLGADTPTLQIADAASMLGAELVVLASVTLFDRLQARHVIDELNKRLPDVRVVVACGDDVCADTGLRTEERFRAQEFFGPSHPDHLPASPDADVT